MSNIAILASGSGTNAEAIMERMKNSSRGRVALLLSNKPDAYALQRAAKFNVPTHIFSPKTLRENPEQIIEVLRGQNIDLIVLAGFMLLVPGALVEQYPNRIINIHPALLPAYGGKGMYGDNVHRAIIEAREKESGITIHYVNEKYDKGAIIFQARTPIDEQDTAQTLADKIHQLEHLHFPRVIEELCDAK